ncbi:MAG TPA: transporter substrate-binding domain-containing protein [Candidatus Methanoperedens sp.]|nr:transporter substrate-binding domain-containing protein [Candidatus Methanoperedens sp.]
MKKILFFLSFVFVFLFFSPFTFASETKYVKVGAFDNYPLIFKDADGKIKGYYVDLLTEIGIKENIKFEYVPGTWNEGLARIKNGEVDMLTSVGFNEERSSYMDYTKNPIMTVWGELYGLESTEIDGILAVSGKKVGVMEGDINGQNFRKLISSFNIECEFVNHASYDEVFKAVSEGRVDVGAVGITFGMSNVGKYGLKSTGVVFSPIGLYFTTAKQTTSQELLPILDKYLQEWKANDNSIYFTAKKKWMSGSEDKNLLESPVLRYGIIGGGSLFLILLIFTISLKLQVNKITHKIREESKEVKKNEEKWRSLFETSKDALVTLELPEMFFSAVNQSAVELFGAKDVEELKTHSVVDLSPEKQLDESMSAEKAKRVIDEAVNNGSNFFEWTHKRIDGKEFLANVLLTKMEIDGKTFIQGTIRDVTESKRLEKELIESKMVLQSKIKELEEMNKLTVGRELKMVEMKKELEEIKSQKDGVVRGE